MKSGICLLLLLLLIMGCVSKPKTVSLNYTGPVVVRKFDIDKTINGNPVILNNEIVSKMRDTLFNYIVRDIPKSYQLTVTDTCNRNTLEIHGEFEKVNTDTDLKLNPLITFLSYRELILKATIKGEIVECETGKVLSRFTRDTKDNDFDVLIRTLSETVVDEFEFIAVKKMAGRK